jgi:hypothetical protein
MKNCVSPAINCTREIGTFSDMDLTKFLMCAVSLNMITISGKTHFKMILSFLPGTGKYFIGNMLYSSDDCVMQLIHILQFFTINNVFYKCAEKIQGSQICRMRGLGIGPLLSIRKLPARKAHNLMEEVRWCLI